MMTLNVNTCWIAPNGEVFPVKIHHHAEFANQVLGTDLKGDKAILALACKGWLRVGFTPFVGVIRYVDLSQAQANALLSVYDSVTSGLVHQFLSDYINS